MPFFREVNTGQVIEVTGEHRTAKFHRLARWEEVDEPAKATATGDAKSETKGEAKPTPTRRRRSVAK